MTSDYERIMYANKLLKSYCTTVHKMMVSQDVVGVPINVIFRNGVKKSKMLAPELEKSLQRILNDSSLRVYVTNTYRTKRL